MKYKIGRYPNGITLNPMEFVLDDDNKIMIFDDLEKAKSFLESNGINNFNGYEFEECDKNGN